jgi:hypothetical protein
MNRMGTFEETATVDYCLLFTTKENNFRFLFAENKRKFAVYIYINISMYIYLSIHIYVNRYLCCRFKRKTEAQAILVNPFTVC